VAGGNLAISDLPRGNRSFSLRTGVCLAEVVVEAHCVVLGDFKCSFRVFV